MRNLKSIFTKNNIVKLAVCFINNLQFIQTLILGSILSQNVTDFHIINSYYYV